MSKIEATIKVSELEEFQTLINELVESYRYLPGQVKDAMSDLGIRSDDYCRSSGQVDGIFAEPTDHFDMKGASMEYKPAEIIQQAREKAERAIMKTCEGEIRRICDDFSYDTGLAVNSVRFSMVGVRRINSAAPEAVLNSVSLDHESA